MLNIVLLWGVWSWLPPFLEVSSVLYFGVGTVGSVGTVGNMGTVGSLGTVGYVCTVGTVGYDHDLLTTLNT